MGTEAQYIFLFFFDGVKVEKKHWFETKFFNDKQAFSQSQARAGHVTINHYRALTSDSQKFSVLNRTFRDRP